MRAYRPVQMHNRRLLRVVRPNGQISHYEGDKDNERLVRCGGPNGIARDYKGAPGMEREVCVQYTLSTIPTRNLAEFSRFE